MAMQLGQVLVEQGALTQEQVNTVLRMQRQTRRPFGALAEEMFNLEPDIIEAAWASQYAEIAEHVNPMDEQIDGAVLGMVDRRQAWQFRIMPMRLDGSEIRVATTPNHLLRAMRFALRHFGHACYFVLAQPEDLAQAMSEHFPMPGMGVETLMSDEPIYRTAS